jgi:Fur family ferric uptake transcriptional regulator
VVYEELRKLTSHPTAGELHAIARARLPRISLGTVYRNLELLAGMGLVRKLETSGAEARFDACTEDHFHVRCVRCGRLDDAHEVPRDPLKDEVRSLDGYEILGYRLEFIGVCPACKDGAGAAGDQSVGQQ